MKLVKLTIPKLTLGQLSPQSAMTAPRRNSGGDATIYECSDGLWYECSNGKLYAVRAEKKVNNN